MLESGTVAAGNDGAKSQDAERADDGLIQRRFTKAGVHPYDEVKWETRTASISGGGGEVVFEQDDVEVPSFWSQTATNVVVNKYFRGHVGTPERENSVRQLIGRVADTITAWGRRGGYFRDDAEGDAFQAELTHLLLHQKVAFNSPVWFNVGVETEPQCSACFINSVDDTMESIMDLAKTEGMLFKWGSGTGTNFSTLRSSRENLAGGGTASGPVSFMRGYDAFAGVIKSGGKTRRAAKMVILDVGHPDVMEFVRCKEVEERKAWALIEAGYDAAFNVTGGAYDSIGYQNANHSVRVTDDFMRAVDEDADWTTTGVKGGDVVDTYRARDVLQAMSEAAWVCGDPGIQYDTIINDWHTCPNTARINASNPCSEYMFLDDSACNLASLNLMKYRDADGEFMVDDFRHAVRITLTAQEILVDNASYPTKEIGRNSYDYRPLGLGFANLGALLMARGLPYDSEAGRAYAGAITALMHGEAYRSSALIAGRMGPFAGFARNRQPMLRVVGKHADAVSDIDRSYVPHGLYDAAKETYEDALRIGRSAGYRNSQVTVLAPTGTIAFMMDCDTTGIEPDIALVKYKRLVGGGMLKLVNQTVPEALTRLGYSDEERQQILSFVDEHETIEGAPGLKDEHLPVFDCAFRAANGSRTIAPMGHVKMMSACQPFLSGAISKTVNVPENATAEEIGDIYSESWRLGLKAIAVYRDGCKRSQPLSTKEDDGVTDAAAAEHVPVRRALADERDSLTHKFKVGGHTGYLTVGLFPDGTPAELFLVVGKEGGVVRGLLDGFATSVSLALQYGVPLRELVDRFTGMSFEPAGWTPNTDVPYAKSILDYVFRYLALKFLADDELASSAVAQQQLPLGDTEPGVLVAGLSSPTRQTGIDGPPCPECASPTRRNGACYACPQCGATTGCG